MKRSPLIRKTDTASLNVPVFKPRRCNAKKGGCGETFTPRRQMQSACGPICAQAFAELANSKKLAKQAKEDRISHRKAVEATKSLSWWAGKAEKAINRYVRARDYWLGCVSCEKSATWDGQWHASHLRSVGAASAVRFNLWNIHKACWICNKLYSGRIDAYKPQAIERIGAEKVDWLYSQNQRVKYQREYLERLASVFNRKATRQEKRNAMQG